MTEGLENQARNIQSGTSGHTMQIKTISSATTLFLKAFIAFWIVSFGAGILFIWSGGITVTDKTQSLFIFEMKLVATAIWFFGAVAFLWVYSPMKRVRLDNKNLYVSNYFREAIVPLNNIQDIMQGRFGGNMPIIIRFKDTTVVGKRVTFLPKALLRFSMRPHPIVAELKQLAGLEE